MRYATFDTEAAAKAASAAEALDWGCNPATTRYWLTWRQCSEGKWHLICPDSYTEVQGTPTHDTEPEWPADPDPI